METKIERLKRLNLQQTAGEDKQIVLINERLSHLENELAIKSKLGFKKCDPDYEYENAPEFLEHMKKSFELTIKEEILRLEQALEQVDNSRRTRLEEIEYLESAANE